MCTLMTNLADSHVTYHQKVRMRLILSFCRWQYNECTLAFVLLYMWSIVLLLSYVYMCQLSKPGLCLYWSPYITYTYPKLLHIKQMCEFTPRLQM